MKELKPDYSQCWANCLGDCAEGMSQEHLVSECLFNGAVRVKGLPWCKDEEKTIGKSSLTSRCLCRHHNSRLGDEVDGASLLTLDTLKEAFELWGARKNIVTRNWRLKYFTTDMLLLERWCLKTLININLNLKPGFPIQDGSNMPTEELVRVAFGLDRFKPPMGLYRAAERGKEYTFTGDGMHIETRGLNDKLCGATFDLWGLPYILHLIQQPLMMDDQILIRGEHKQWFNTRDRRGREVHSHLMTFTYPKP